MQKGEGQKMNIGLKMAPVSGTAGGQIRTGPTGKLPEIDRRTGVYFVPCSKEKICFTYFFEKLLSTQRKNAEHC